MDDSTKELLKILLTSLGAGLVAWIASKLSFRSAVTVAEVQGLIRKDVESMLASMKGEIDGQLQAAQHEFQRKAVMHEIKYRKLYDKVADVVEQVFLKVAETYKAGSMMVSEIEFEPARRYSTFKTFGARFNELHEYIFLNRIFLPTRLHHVLNELMDPLKRAGEEFEWPNVPEEDTDQLFHVYRVANQAFEERITPVYEKLCREIQHFIGLEEQGAKSNAQRDGIARSPNPIEMPL